jgi:hypothetical protein
MDTDRIEPPRRGKRLAHKTQKEKATAKEKVYWAGVACPFPVPIRVYP